VRDNKLQAMGTDSSPGWVPLLDPLAKAEGLVLATGGDGYGPSDQMSFALRARGSHGDISRAAVQALQTLDSKVPPFEIQPMQALLSASTAQRSIRCSSSPLSPPWRCSWPRWASATSSLFRPAAHRGDRRPVAPRADARRIVGGPGERVVWWSLFAGAVRLVAAPLAGFLVGIGPADPVALERPGWCWP
jgi:hypothetical protein